MDSGNQLPIRKIHPVIRPSSVFHSAIKGGFIYFRDHGFELPLPTSGDPQWFTCLSSTAQHVPNQTFFTFILVDLKQS